MERLRKFKKGLAYLLSMALVIGGFYTNSLSAKAEGEENSPAPPTTNEYVVHYDNRDYANVVVGTEQVNDGTTNTFTKGTELEFQLNPPADRAEKTPVVAIYVHTDSGDTIYRTNPGQGENQITLTDNNRKFIFIPTTDDPFDVDIRWSTYDAFDGTDAKPIIVEVVCEATDDCPVTIDGIAADDKIVDGNLMKVRVGSDTNSINLSWTGNDPREIRVDEGTNYSSFANKSQVVELPSSNGDNRFYCVVVDFNAQGGGEGPNLNANEYIVRYDRRDNANVVVGTEQVIDGTTNTFTQGTELKFQLNPPADRANKTPVVAIYVRAESEIVYRTNPSEGENQITLTDNNRKFTFTPTTGDPFEVFIDWSEYDAFGETNEKPIIVEVECEATENCPVTVEGIADDDKMTDGNRMKVRVASGTSSINLIWTGNDPREISVDGGTKYSNFANKSQVVELPSTNGDNRFYHVAVDFNAQGGGEGGNPGGEGGNGGEGGQSRPQSPELVKANKGELVINVSGPVEGGVLSYRIGDQTGYTEVQPNKLPLKLDGLKLNQGDVVQIGFITSGGYQFDNGQGNTIQIDDGTPTNIDLDSLSKRTYEITYDPEKAVTIDIKTVESQPQGGQFDGTAYLFWEGDNKQICKYKFEKLSTSHKEGEGENAIDVYDVNFVKASDIKDAEKGDVFSIKKKFEFVYPDKVDDSRTAHLFDGKLSENDKHAITMNPTDSAEGQTSVTWTPDREFRITFYEDGYQGICLVTSGMSYPEAPFNETVFGIKDKDIGGTTKENPAILPVYGLEQSITVTAGDNSKPIKKIIPLDIPDGAITVSEVTTGKFNIVFHSNFFDKVVYQVTDENDKIYYVRIIRETLEAHDNFGPGMAESDMEITANFYFPTGNSYSEYQMVASLWVQDEKGQNVIKEVKVVQPGIVKDMDGASTGKYEVPIGATLKQSSYIVPVDKSIVAVSFNILKSGEMDGDTFSGAISGSGDGAYYDIEARRIIYDNVKEEQN